MPSSDPPGELEPPNEVQRQVRLHALAAAALLGGTVAAGAYFGTRALARKNGKDGRGLNSVMATAITACDLAHAKDPPGHGEERSDEAIQAPDA